MSGSVYHPIEIMIIGKPAPAGSYRPVPIRKGGVVVASRIVDSSKSTKPWQAMVQAAAIDEVSKRDGWEPFDGPVEMFADFFFARPKCHLRTGGRLAPAAPARHTTRPDASKLLRAVEDALTGVVYRDDSQIALVMSRKHWDDRTSFCRIKLYFSGK